MRKSIKTSLTVVAAVSALSNTAKWQIWVGDVHDRIIDTAASKRELP